MYSYVLQGKQADRYSERHAGRYVEKIGGEVKGQKQKGKKRA